MIQNTMDYNAIKFQGHFTVKNIIPKETENLLKRTYLKVLFMQIILFIEFKRIVITYQKIYFVRQVLI